MTTKIPSWLADDLEADVVPVFIESSPESSRYITRINATMAYVESLTGHANPLQAL